MQLFICRFAYDVGGKGTNHYHSAATMTLEELRKAHATLVEKGIDCRLFLPPRGKAILKSKVTPRLIIAERSVPRVVEMGAVKVPNEYIPILNWILKKEYYESYSGVGMTEIAEKKFQHEIRAKRNILLRTQSWVDEPSDPALENLNQLIEKIDLGRRTDLQYSSHQDEEVFNNTIKFGKGKTKEEKEAPTLEDLPMRIKPEDVYVPPSAKNFLDYKKDHS